MNKTEFMSLLDRHLGNIPFEQKKEIMYDYEEHFSIGLKNGKPEGEIANDLGDPVNIAKQYRAEFMLKEAENNTSTNNIFRAVLAVVGLGFFNLFFVLGPFLGIVGIIIGLFAAALALTVSGIAAFLASLFYPLYINILPIEISLPAGISQIAMIFISIGIGSLGVLSTIGVAKLAQFLYEVTIRYLRYNIEIVKR